MKNVAGQSTLSHFVAVVPSETLELLFHEIKVCTAGASREHATKSKVDPENQSGGFE